MRCLITETDHVTGELWKLALESQGHSVDLAGTTDQAVDAVRLHSYDLLFVDAGLPNGGAPVIADIAHAQQPLARVVMVASPAARGHGALFAVMPHTAAILRRPLSVVDLMVFTDSLARQPQWVGSPA